MIAILLCDVITIKTTVCYNNTVNYCMSCINYSILSFMRYNESVDYQSCVQLWLKFCTENVCIDHSIVHCWSTFLYALTTWCEQVWCIHSIHIVDARIWDSSRYIHEPGVQDTCVSLALAMDGNDAICNATNGTVAGAGKWALSLVGIFVFSVIFVFLITVLCLVVAAKAVRGTIRFVLVNSLIASMTICFGIALICLGKLLYINHWVSHNDSVELAVKFLLAVILIGGNGRSAFLLVFAVVMVIIIKGPSSAVKFKYLVISTLVVWIACVAVSMLVFVPGVVSVVSFNSSILDIHLRAGPQSWIFAVLYFPFFAALPFTLAVAMPVYALCYIRNNAVSENATSLKPMLKFALFLLIGNLLCIMGLSVGVAISLITRLLDSNVEVVLFLLRMYYVLLALSLIPTPVLILVYFKPVRVQMRKCLLRICSKWCKRNVIMSKQDPLTEMMLVSTADNQ